ncbi:MAG: hypothetical protein ABIO70_18900, partial [Pseudomonadota bacterium]
VEASGQRAVPPARPGDAPTDPRTWQAAAAPAVSSAVVRPLAPGARSVPGLRHEPTRAYVEQARAGEPPAWSGAVPAMAWPTGTERALARLVESVSLAQAVSQGLAAAWAQHRPPPGASAGLARMFSLAGRAPETLWLQWRSQVPAEGPPPQALVPGGAVARSSWGARSAQVVRPRAAPGPRQVALPVAGARSRAAATVPGVALWAAGLPVIEGAALAAEPFLAPTGAVPTPGALPGRQALRRLRGLTRPEQRLLALNGRSTEVAREGALPFQAPGAQPPRPREVPRRGRVEAVPAVRAAARPLQVRPATIDALLGAGAGAQILVSVLRGIEQPDAALQVVLERALGLGRSGHLPAPVQRLVQQVREGAAESEEAPGATRRPDSPAPARETLRRRRRARSLRRPGSGEPTRADATVHHVQANYRIAGLVKKLEQLIHLVDVEHRLAAARSQVRMAEDSAAARPSPGTGSAEEARDQQAGQDVDALVKRIVEDVQEQLGQWSQQRPDDPTAVGPWW